MKKIIFLLILTILLPAYAFCKDIGYLRSSLVEGDAQINTEYITEWLPLSINVPIREKDKIWVPDGSKVELNTRDGSYIRLNEYSSLEVINLERNFLRFYMPSGHLYINYKPYKDSLLKIDLDESTIIASTRALFRVDVSNSSSKISVFKGEVKVENRDGRIVVTEGKTLSLREGYGPEITSLGPVDDWERWNRERDRTITEKRYSYKYLPDELREYSYDFDNYGDWVYVRDYGYVWTPRLAVHVEWAPYRNGRWVWIGADYVWISYDPWGWVPHHYGRWVFVARIGWCWVPPKKGYVYWAPGYVAWVYTPGYVAWVPLAPYEIYYGYGYFGPYSVNIINIDIRKIKVKTIYKNIHVKNAVTIVHKDTFIKGKPDKIKIDENPFIKHKISIGRPDIKPERETFMPKIKDIPHTKLPPPILEKKFKEEKRVRPSYKEKEISRSKDERIDKNKEKSEDGRMEKPAIKEPIFKDQRQKGRGQYPSIQEKTFEREEKIEKMKPFKDKEPISPKRSETRDDRGIRYEKGKSGKKVLDEKTPQQDSLDWNIKGQKDRKRGKEKEE